MHRFSCHHCGKHLSYQIKQLGMRIKCPKCHQVITVGLEPTSEATPAAGALAFLRHERLWPFVGGLLVVAVAVVLLWRRFL